MWSRKIAQFATPRNKSSRRSRPFSGRVALIFMGAVSKGCFRQDRAAGEGAAARPAKIVTAQHNDYTGQESLTSSGRNHRSNSRKVILYHTRRLQHAPPCRTSHGALTSINAPIFKPARNPMQFAPALTQERQVDY